MQKKIHILNPKDDVGRGYCPSENYMFASKRVVIPTTVREMSLALPFYPIAFARIGENDWRLVLLTGIERDVNVCISVSGRWLLPYIPENIQHYPFVLVKSAEKATEEAGITLGFDIDSGLFRERVIEGDGSNEFFDSSGHPLSEIRERLRLLQQHTSHVMHASKAVTQLAKYGLLKPWELSPGLSSQSQIGGLFCVDEKKLYDVSPEIARELHVSQALTVAYGNLFSLPRLVLLRRLHEQHDARRAAANSDSNAAVVSDLFDEKDDTLKFNF